MSVSWTYRVSAGLFLLVVTLFILPGCATPYSRKSVNVDKFLGYNLDTELLERLKQQKPLQIQDLEEAVCKDIPKSTLIEYLKSTQAIYELKTADIDHLRSAGASDELINYWLSTPHRFEDDVYYRRGYRHHPYRYHGYYQAIPGLLWITLALPAGTLPIGEGMGAGVGSVKVLFADACAPP